MNARQLSAPVALVSFVIAGPAAQLLGLSPVGTACVVLGIAVIVGTVVHVVVTVRSDRRANEVAGKAFEARMAAVRLRQQRRRQRSRVGDQR